MFEGKEWVNRNLIYRIIDIHTCRFLFPTSLSERKKKEESAACKVRPDARVAFRTAGQNEAHCFAVSFAATKNHLIVP